MSHAPLDRDLAVTWRGDVANSELNALHADAFDHRLVDDDWVSQLDRFSLGWVTARHDRTLVGFVNVLTDGGAHAWVQDVIVAGAAQRRGIGRQMIDLVRQHTTTAGCEWLHVDFDDEHTSFYLDVCGFTPTRAGLIEL